MASELNVGKINVSGTTGYSHFTTNVAGDTEVIRVENLTASQNAWISLYRSGTENGRLTTAYDEITLQAQNGKDVKIIDDGGLGLTVAEGGLATFTNGIAVTTGGISVTAGGVTFPATQSASAGSNTLDDYEEGTWTATYTGSGGASGVTYSTNTCTYTKVGRLVTCQAHVVLSDKGTVGGVTKIIGLPFTPSAAPQFVTGALTAGNFTLDADQQMAALQYGANAFLYLFKQEPGTALVQATATQTNDTSEFVMTCSYNTA